MTDIKLRNRALAEIHSLQRTAGYTYSQAYAAILSKPEFASLSGTDSAQVANTAAPAFLRMDGAHRRELQDLIAANRKVSGRTYEAAFQMSWDAMMQKHPEFANSAAAPDFTAAPARAMKLRELLKKTADALGLDLNKSYSTVWSKLMASDEGKNLMAEMYSPSSRESAPLVGNRKSGSNTPARVPDRGSSAQIIQAPPNTPPALKQYSDSAAATSWAKGQ
jgi:hypothetical protein